jgi:hypothetical protein
MKRSQSAATQITPANTSEKNTPAEARSLVMRIASCFLGSMWSHRRSIAVLRNSTARTKRMLPARATQVHKSLATKKDRGRRRQAMATSCLIADSVESPS